MNSKQISYFLVSSTEFLDPPVIILAYKFAVKVKTVWQFNVNFKKSLTQNIVLSFHCSESPKMNWKSHNSRAVGFMAQHENSSICTICSNVLLKYSLRSPEPINPAGHILIYDIFLLFPILFCHSFKRLI